MIRNFNIIVLLGLVNSGLYCMTDSRSMEALCQQDKTVVLRPIDGVAKLASALTTLLFSQKLIKGRYSLKLEDKNLIDLWGNLIENLRSTHILSRTNDSDNWLYLGFKNGIIAKSFHDAKRHVYTTNPPPIGIYVDNVCFESELFQEFLNSNKSKFKEIIALLKSGWTFSPSGGHAEGVFEGYWAEEAPNPDYVYFVKDKLLHREADLINILAHRFSIPAVVAWDSACSNQLKKGKVVFGIKKSEFNKFMEHFGFCDLKGNLLTVQ